MLSTEKIDKLCEMLKDRNLMLTDDIDVSLKPIYDINDFDGAIEENENGVRKLKAGTELERVPDKGLTKHVSLMMNVKDSDYAILHFAYKKGEVEELLANSKFVDK